MANDAGQRPLCRRARARGGAPAGARAARRSTCRCASGCCSASGWTSRSPLDGLESAVDRSAAERLARLGLAELRTAPDGELLDAHAPRPLPRRRRDGRAAGLSSGHGRAVRAEARDPPARRRGLRRHRRAGRLEGARGAVWPRSVVVDGARTSSRSSSRSGCSRIRTRAPGRVPTESRLPALRRRAPGPARAAAGAVPARPDADAQRGGGRAPVDDRDARAGHAAARARLGAAARDGERSARRGARAAAASS